MSSRDSGMGSLERLIFSLVPLAVAIAAAVVLLLVGGLIDQEQLGRFGPQLTPLLQLAERDLVGRLTVAGGSLLVGSLALLVMLRALRGSGASDRTTEQRHILAADEKGLVVVQGAGVATVAGAAAKRVGGVMDVRVKVSGSGAAPVRLEVTARVSAAAELRRVGEEVRRRAAEAVQTLVGIDVSEVVVKIDVVPLEELGRVVR